MTEPAKITIVEGPPPRFEPSTDSWVEAITEGPRNRHSARCLLRTMNGAQLVERCQDAWSEGREAHLEYRTSSGTTEVALIVAVRTGKVDAGQVLHLWLRLDRMAEMLEEAAGGRDEDLDDDSDGDDEGDDN